VLAVVLLSQGAGLVLIAILVAVRGDGAPDGEYLVYAAVSGVAGIAGVGAFYRGLAVGAMAVVAPISATAAAIPVVVGVATGDRPSAVQAAGLVLALVGVVLVSREEPGGEGFQAAGRVAAGVGLALVAAVGFGCFFLAMDKASDGDVFWAILVNRVTGVSLVAVAVLALRPRLGVGADGGRALFAVGCLDISANTLFAAASTEGLVSIVAVLGSLYPVMVIVLARVVLHERVRRIQQAGAGLALLGVALISAG
jgi:drug/metabolite transporter (DMT)-like permease